MAMPMEFSSRELNSISLTAQTLIQSSSVLKGDGIGGVTHLLVAFAAAHAMVSIRVAEME